MAKLERLIANLSKNEKAYFKRWLPNSAKDKKFVSVFQQIEKDPSISSKELLKKLGPGATPKKLETQKAHLWSSLLLSLRDYHRKNDLQLQFNSRSDAIKILRTKGQLDDALRDSESLLKDCEEIGMIPEAIRAIEHLENIHALKSSSDEEAENFWVNLYKKKEILGLQMAEGSKIRSFERRLKLLNDRLGSSLTTEDHQELISELHRELNETGVSDIANVDIRFRYFQTQAIIARIFENTEDEQQWFKKVFLLLEANPRITNTYYTAFYIVALHNYLDALLYSRLFEDIPTLLQRMKHWLGENPSLIGRDFYFLANDTLAFHILKEDYEEGLRKWNEFEREAPMGTPPREDLYVRFMTLGSVVCLWCNEHRRALSILRSLFKEVEPACKSDVYDIAKTIEIICNYELGDDNHAEHLIGINMRKGTGGNHASAMETLTIQTISRLLKAKKPSRELWNELAEQLESMCLSPDERLKLLTFDFLKYAKEKAASRRFL